MPSVEFEGRRVEIRAGDSIASALYRAGVRIFSRSFKYHRPRGLYCLTGDCPNCLLTVDDEPAVRACCTSAREGQRIRRGVGWPSAESDMFSIFWYLRWMLPVGFYYKTFIRPRALWPVMDRIIRQVAGLGEVPQDARPSHRETWHHHPDVLVIGGGVAGLSAALAATESGRSVVLADEHSIGEKIPPGATRARIDTLLGALRGKPNVTILEHAAAVGIFEGPLVPIDAPDFLHHIHPAQIVVATGAVERHRCICSPRSANVAGAPSGTAGSKRRRSSGSRPHGPRRCSVGRYQVPTRPWLLMRRHGDERRHPSI